MTALLERLPTLGAGTWFLVVAGAVVVGFSKTALPGGGTIAVGLFALALPAKESTAALLLLLIVGDAIAVWTYRRDADVRTLLRLLPNVLVGLAVGAVFLAIAGGELVQRVIGLILLALIGITLWRRRRTRIQLAPEAGDKEPPPATAAATIGRAGYGALGGFTTMVANAGGPVMSMYFYAMRMPVLTFLGTSAWFFAAVNLLKLPFSAGLGLITVETVATDAVLIPLVLLGAAVGRATARRVPQVVFEVAVLVLTASSALALLVV